MAQDGIYAAEAQVGSVLMIGQSNMAGRGDLGQVKPIHNPLCYMLRMGRWQPMCEPVNPDRAIFEGIFRSGVSLAASFADEYARKFQTPVGLIPCADGGTQISQWMPGEILFDNAVHCARLALRTTCAQDSRNIIGKNGAEKLPSPRTAGKAYGYYRNDIDLGLYEIPVYTDEEHRRLVNFWQAARATA